MHTFLIIPCDKIPHNCDHTCCRHSNDNQFVLVDGYNTETGQIVAPEWVTDDVLVYANEYTKEQINELASNPSSIWYVEPEELI